MVSDRQDTGERQLISPDELWNDITEEWYTRTWWGKLVFIPVLAIICVLYGPLLLFHRIAQSLPPKYKEDADASQ